MKRASIFLTKLKHIGALQIQILEPNATVISVLGMCSYNFGLLPQNRNNKYAILRLTLKAYLNSLIENFDELETSLKMQKIGVFEMMKSFITTFTIEASDPIECIKRKIIKDHKEIDWENVEDFMEIDTYESILDLYPVPILVCFSNFQSDLLPDERNLTITEKDALQLQITQKNISSSDKLEVLKSFVISEIKYYFVLKEWQKEFQQNAEFSSIGFISKAYRNICEKFIELLQINESVDVFLSKGALYAKEKVIDFWNVANPNSKDISTVYINLFDGFRSYFDFVKEYEITAESLTVVKREIIVFILSRVTNYTKKFTDLCEIEDSLEARVIAMKFYRFNKILNEHSEKIHMKVLSENYKYVFEEGIGDLVAMLECIKSADFLNIYFTSTVLFISSKKKDIKLLCKLGDVNMLVYNKSIYLILNKYERLELPFKTTPYSSEKILSLNTTNKEAAHDFCDKFYLTKYQCKKKDNYFYSIEDLKKSLNKDIDHSIVQHGLAHALFENQNKIAVSKLDSDFCDCEILKDSDKGKYNMVKIEDFSFRTGGVMSLTDKELFSRIKEVASIKRNNFLCRMENLGNMIAILDQINESGLKPFYLDVYPEDETSFKRKMEIFNRLCSIIPMKLERIQKKENRKEEEPATNFSYMLYPNDIIKNFEEEKQGIITKKYLNAIYASPGAEISECSLEESVILFGMLLQRNLYYFFDANDIQRLTREVLVSIREEDLKGFKPYTSSNIKKLCKVVEQLHKNGEEQLMNMLFDAVTLPKA
ncbi:hypothetical protein GINT2_001043 [Glugoides intestinalis]